MKSLLQYIVLLPDVYDDEVSTVVSSERFEPVAGQKLAKVCTKCQKFIINHNCSIFKPFRKFN